MVNRSGSNTPKDTQSSVPERVSEAWLATISKLVAVRSPLAEQTYARLLERTEFNAKQRKRLDRLAPWVKKIAQAGNVVSAPPDEFSFGVMGYQCADYVAASRNIGDWVQTISIMSHFARRPDLTFTGDSGLSAFMSSLQNGVPEEKQIAGPKAKVSLVEFNRDASFYDSLPETLWAFIFGWHFKLPFGKLEFPLPKNIKPIFVSFHISNQNHINEDAISYLKLHAPIGCRDWHTVRLLNAKGVECYFSGCVTTTVGGLFPTSAFDPLKPVAYVDSGVDQISENEVTLTNLIEEMRTLPLSKSLEMARDRLNSYRLDFSKIVTSRLHTFLPSESMGVAVDWKPVHVDDRRFDGLTGPKDMPHEQMSERIAQIIKAILDKILSGETADNIYKFYRAEVASEISDSLAKISNVS